MSEMTIAWLLAYQFADVYDSEIAWQKDFELFKSKLAVFRSING